MSHVAAAAAAADMPHFHTSPNAVSVVVGASRGLGLALSAALLQRSPGHVVALARQPEEAPALMALKEAAGGRLSCFSCDVTDAASLRRMAERVKTEHEQIDLLLNVAGILHEPAEGGSMDAVRQPERRLAAVDPEWMARVYAVNAMGPVLTTQAVQPLLSKGAVIASLSARVGSIGDNRMGGWWSYRMSKSALNMGARPPPSAPCPCPCPALSCPVDTCTWHVHVHVHVHVPRSISTAATACADCSVPGVLAATRNMANEMKRDQVIAVALHPGTTATDLSAPFQKNVKPEKLFSTEYTAGMLLDVLQGLTPEDSGGFFAYDGSEIEW